MPLKYVNKYAAVSVCVSVVFYAQLDTLQLYSMACLTLQAR